MNGVLKVRVSSQVLNGDAKSAKDRSFDERYGLAKSHVSRSYIIAFEIVDYPHIKKKPKTY